MVSRAMGPVPPAAGRAAALPTAALLAAGVLALGACGLFTDSLFPRFLSGVEASRDLSSRVDGWLMPEEQDWDAQVSVLRDAGGSDYVFLLVRAFRGHRLITLDSDLRVLLTLDNQPFGERAMVDAMGRFVIGDAILGNPPDSMAGTVALTGTSWIPGFAYGIHNYLVRVDSPTTLWYARVDNVWSAASAWTAVEIAATGNWRLDGLACDPDRPANQKVILFLVNQLSGGTAEIHVLATPEAGYDGFLTADLIGYYPTLTTIRAQDVEQVHYTRKGIVVRQWDRDRERAVLYRSDLYAQFGEMLGELPIDSRHDIRDAYDIDGEHYYFFDRDARTLFKGRTGW